MRLLRIRQVLRPSSILSKQFHGCRSDTPSKCWEGTLNVGQHTSLGKSWFHPRCGPASWPRLSTSETGKICNRESKPPLPRWRKWNRTSAKCWIFDIFFFFLIKQWTNTTTDVPTSFTSYFVSIMIQRDIHDLIEICVPSLSNTKKADKTRVHSLDACPVPIPNAWDFD